MVHSSDFVACAQACTKSEEWIMNFCLFYAKILVGFLCLLSRKRNSLTR
jgi:hypothetical protein